jgi:hypothetical protein
MSGFHDPATGRTHDATARPRRARSGRAPRSSRPFARLDESDRLAQDLAALVEAGLIAPVASGEETRYEPIE